MGVGHSQGVPASADGRYVPWGVYAQDHLGVSFQQVAETILTSAAADVTFSNIPATFASLRVELTARCDSANASEALYARFNADATANYDFEYLYGVGASPAAGEGIASFSIFAGYCAGAAAPANVGNSALIWVPDYARTVFKKTVLCTWIGKNSDASGGMLAGMSVGVWRNTAVVSEIKLFPGAGQFVAGCRFALLGNL
jgi:hypothetical protein